MVLVLCRGHGSPKASAWMQQHGDPGANASNQANGLIRRVCNALFPMTVFCLVLNAEAKQGRRSSSRGRDEARRRSQMT